MIIWIDRRHVIRHEVPSWATVENVLPPPTATAPLAVEDTSVPAAVALTTSAVEEAVTTGVELLSHIREAFDGAAYISTTALLDRLCERDESPWKDIRGKPLNDRGRASRLKGYGIKSKTVRANGATPKGYAAADFADAWKRYVSPPVVASATSATSATTLISNNNYVADVADVAAREAPGNGQADDEPEPGSFEPDDLELPAFLDRRPRP